MAREDAVLRIGEVSKRSGVTPELLRAWERRYGLLRPERSSGGLRLYSASDVERVRLMRQHLDSGLAAAEAAALASREAAGDTSIPYALPANALRDELADALDRFDEPTAQTVIDRLLAAATVDTFLADVVLPYLGDLGDRWQHGKASVAQEHFATSVLRGRLLGLARGWGRGSGAFALLASVPGEQHELGLIAFGLTLRSRGWRIGYLGSDTPLDTVARAASSLAPTLIVLNAVTAERVHAVERQLKTLADDYVVAVGGAGARALDPEGSRPLALTGDPVAEAERAAALVQKASRTRGRGTRAATSTTGSGS